MKAGEACVPEDGGLERWVGFGEDGRAFQVGRMAWGGRGGGGAACSGSWRDVQNWRLRGPGLPHGL